ncbi:MAG TPA: ABC transporter ATP-binding protein [Bacteroidaceae bacterium]|nr:ABC transporter ATP-binding protein [Bacteroidaceae bacterium]
MKNTLNMFFKAFALIYNSDKKLFSTRIFLMILESVLPIALLYIIKYMIDMVEAIISSPDSINMTQVLIFVIILCTVYVLNELTVVFDNFINEILGQKMVDRVSRIIQQKSMELDMSYYDNSKYFDAMYLAQQEAGYRPLQILSHFTRLFINTLTLIGIVVILVDFSWLTIVIMLIAGVPSLFIKIKRSRTLYEWRKSNVKINRKAIYYSQLLTAKPFAKELRVYGLGEFFQQRFWKIRTRLLSELKNILKRMTQLDMLAVFVEILAICGIVYILAYNTFAGVVTIGGFVMYLQAFRKGNVCVQGAVKSVSGIYENRLFVNNLFDFLALKPKIDSPVTPVLFPKEIKSGLKFENVSFCYPGSSKIVLDKLNLELIPGQINRVKGANGIGKTTMVKLICRLYDCTEGKITIEGIDIKKFNINELRENISVIFQDFVGYSFTARDNIITNKPLNDNRLHEAAISGQAHTVVTNLIEGYDTLLGKTFEGGEELSMGQWQRIALSRALYRNTPILILDEPTSWMDVETKEKFRQLLPELAKKQLLLLISHEE